jgi:hypothetical protein
MSEKDDAIRLANKVLDTPNRDPDDDLSMMSRQFLRALEPTSRLRSAGFSLRIEDVRLTLYEDPDRIALDRDGEGGEFSLKEFARMLHRFISERL